MDENNALSENNKIPLGHNRTNGVVYTKIFAEMEALASALRYIKVSESSKFVIFCDSKSALQALLSRWDHPSVLIILNCLICMQKIKVLVAQSYGYIW